MNNKADFLHGATALKEHAIEIDEPKNINFTDKTELFILYIKIIFVAGLGCGILVFING